MAIDMFIKIDGIDGESQDDKHTKEIQLESFSLGTNNIGSSGVGSGVGAGKVSFQDLNCTKLVDSASPLLLKKCAMGEHIAQAVLTVRKAGGKQEDYLQIKLSDLIISSVVHSGSAAGDLPMESFSINYSKIDMGYKPQDKNGTLGAAITGGWDLKKNVEV